MSDFQLALLCIGVAIVVIVVAFNKWQEVRYRQSAEGSLKSTHADILLRENEDGVNSVEQHPVEANISIEDSGIPASQSQATQSQAGSQSTNQRPDKDRKYTGGISRSIHMLVSLDAPLGISIKELALDNPIIESLRAKIRIEGSVDGVWAQPQDGVRYAQMIVGFQLADRRGPVSRKDIEAFSGWILSAADRSFATASTIDVEEELEKATGLDKFCGEVDIQIALHLVAAEGPFPGTRIRAIAEAAGLSIEGDGSFHKRDEEGRDLFTLINGEGSAFNGEIMKSLATKSLLLSFDVARAPGGVHAFAKYRHFAEHLSSGLGGRLVDDNNKLIDAAGFEAIGTELASVYQAMILRGIVPGGQESLLLFS